MSAAILLVGDDAATLAALTLNCPRADIAVAADAAAALAFLRSRGAGQSLPRLIVLDMPVAPAAVAALKADARGGTLPLMVLCGAVDDDGLDACYRAGANACMFKPAADALPAALAPALAFWLEANEPLPAPD